MHGKQSEVTFDTESLLFKGCPKKAPVARYHSLAADPETMPDVLKVTAVTDDGEIMQYSMWNIRSMEYSFIRSPL